MVSGGPGSGKTVLGLEFLCRGAMAGEPGVFVTFEERADAIRLNASAMGWDLAALEKAGKMAIIEARLPGETNRLRRFRHSGPAGDRGRARQEDRCSADRDGCVGRAAADLRGLEARTQRIVQAP